MFKDSVLKKLYKTHGPHQFADKSENLNEHFPTPEQILKINIEKLRSVGMSYSTKMYFR